MQSRNYDKITKNTIINSENQSVHSFHNHLNKLLNEIDSHPGFLETHDYKKYLINSLNDVYEDVFSHVEKTLPQLYMFGDDKAEEKTASIHTLKNKYSIENTLFKKIAKTSNRHKQDMEYRRSHVGGKIKTLTEDIKQEILKGIDDHVNASPLMRDIVRKQRDRYDEELAKTNDAELRKQIKQKISELYSKQKYKIERAVRTEVLNVVSRAQLLRFEQMDVKEVFLETSHDEKVCAKCRNLENTKKIWDISKLLLLGAYPLSTLTHPQCRCTFTPVIPEIELDNDIGEIKNIPRNETKDVERLTKEIEFTVPIHFVNDITETPEFLENRIQYHVKKGDPPARAKILAENDQQELKGQVATLKIGIGKNKKILLDVKANKTNRFTYLLSKIQAKQIWERYTSKNTIRPQIQKIFDSKHFDRTLSSHKLLFFSRKARSTAKEYFSEGYSQFIVHPQVLKEIDREMFDYLKFHIFNGRDFLNHSFYQVT